MKKVNHILSKVCYICKKEFITENNNGDDDKKYHIK